MTVSDGRTRQKIEIISRENYADCLAVGVMETFEFLLHDDRFDRPAIAQVIVADIGRARERAEGLLAASCHHRGVEVYRGSSALFHLGDCEPRPPHASARRSTTSALGFLRSAVAHALRLVRRPRMLSPDNV
jgi:hypothetical protein